MTMTLEQLNKMMDGARRLSGGGRHLCIGYILF